MLDAVIIAAVVFSGVLGLMIGSFLNVVVWRLPRGESLSYPGSHCPRCDAPISWQHNVPVLSWLYLRGRCRNCAEPISVRNPLVELGTAVLFAYVAWWAAVAAPAAGSAALAWHSIVALVAFLYLAAISVALTLIDLETHTLPNKIVIPAYAVGGLLLACASLLSGDLAALLRAAIGMAAMFAAYFLMAIAYPGGMGLGDVKLAGVLGMFLGWLGWGELVVGAFAAFALGGIFSVILLALRRADRKSGIPFGPWMLAGAWAGIFLGSHIWSGYLAFFALG